MNHGCPSQTPVSFGQRLCPVCGEKERTSNARNDGRRNGTTKHYEELRLSKARKNNRPLDAETLLPILSRLSASTAHFKSLLECFSRIFNLNQSKILF